MIALAKSVFSFLGGVLMLAGLIIGAGMFAIPFSFATAGFWLGAAELFVLSLTVLLVHLAYADVAIRTSETHRLPGYAGMYLGAWGRTVASASIFAGAAGTLVVYLILGSQFLSSALRALGVAEPNTVLTDAGLYVIILAAAGALITYFPIRGEALANGVLTAILIFFIGYLLTLLFPFVREPARVMRWEYAALPYGILLFSLWGGIAVPDIAAFLGKKARHVRWAVAIGTILPAIIYILFAFTIVGTTHDATSRETLSGLRGIAPEDAILLGYTIGLLAVFTSFLVMQKTFQVMLTLDFGAPRLLAWIAGSILPVFLYFFGFTDFIAVISLVGAVAIGVDVLMILLMQYRMRAQSGDPLPRHALLTRAFLFVIVLGAILYHLMGSA